MKAIEMKLANVCRWIKENPETDPNTYEMSDIFVEVSRLDEADVSDEMKQNLQYLGDKRIADLKEKVGVDEKQPLHALQSKLYAAAQSRETVTDDDRAKEYICKCSSVSLYIAQEKKRDPNFKFDNKMELMQMQEMKEYCEQQKANIPAECNQLLGDIEANHLGEKSKNSFMENLKNRSK